MAYRTREWKYIRTESLDEANTVLSEELYDLRNDPQERHNLHGSESEEAKAFELEAVDKILEFKRRKSSERTGYEKERIRAKLKRLPKL
jgi:arylsulfatase A-like enzyme